MEDADGDTATLEGLSAGAFTVSVQNDVPVANDETPRNLTEADPAINGNVLDNDIAGADEAITLTHVNLGSGFVAIDSGSDLGDGDYGFDVAGVGSYSFNADGSWTFTPADSVDNSEGDVDAGFDYRIKDADGDPAEANQPITIADGAAPMAGDPITLTVDDENLADGSNPALPVEDSDDIVFTAGSDAIASIVFATDLTGLDSSLDWTRVSDNQIVGRDGGVDIVTLDLNVVGTTATVKATLNDNYDSHPTFTADDLQALGSVGVIATDIDGDTATGTVNVEVSDDVPDMTVSGTDTVAEDAGSPINGTWDNASAGADGAASTVVKVGSDEYALDSDINLAQGALRVNADGSWTFDPNSLDQDDPQSLTFSVEVTDADNDVASDDHTITITDGAGPMAGDPITLTVDDENLADGSNPALPVEDSDDIVFTAGSDAIASIVFATDLSGLDSSLDWTRVNDNQIVGRDDGVDIVTLDLNVVGTTATVKATLNDNYDSHPTFTADDLQALGSVGVIATDIDGDTATGTVNVEVSDDVPDMTVSGTDTVAEDAGSPINGSWDNASAGADGAASTVVKVGSDEYALDTDINLAQGTLRVNADGSWTFEPNSLDQDDPQSLTFSVEVTDADNDVASDDHTITITDGEGPMAGDPITLTVDDENLADGSNPALPVEDSDDIVFTAGSDAIASIVFATDLTGLDSSLDWTRVSDNQIVGRDGGVDIVTLDLNVVGTTATVKATLNDNYASHPTFTADDLQALGSVGVIATDIDGDTATGTVNVEVSDDVPDMTVSGTDTVAEDAGSPINGTWDNASAGADGAASTVVKVGSDEYALDSDINLAQGALRVNADGSWTFDPNSLDQDDPQSLTFSVEVTDADNDVASDDHTITITDGAGPMAGDPITLTVDDENLADGSNPALPVEDSDDIVFTAGSDAIASIVFATDLSGLDSSLDWTRVNDNQIVGRDDGVDIVTLDLNVVGTTATVKATLNDNYDSHPTFTADDIQALGSVGVIATDIDGDTATGTVNVQVSDDLPSAQDYIGGSYTEGSSNNVVAADAAAALGIAGGADGLNSSLQAISFTGGQGTLFINGSGQLVYTPPANVANTNGNPVDDVFSYTVTDNDNDSVTRQVTVSITDTGVTELSASNALVDEDDLPLGNNDSATGDDNLVSTGSISYNVGADGFDSVSLSTTGDTTGLVTHDGDAVDTTWDSGSNTLIGYVSGTDSSDAANHVFTVSLTNINASGADYDVTLLQPVAHADADNENNVDFTVNVSVFDNDGSEGTTSFNINIDDDVPVATPEENSGDATLVVNTNLMLILDVSGSMDDSANFQGMSRLEVMIKSSLKLIEQYEALGDVMVNIVTFSQDASNSGWVSIADAKAILLGLDAGGGTNYDRALGEAIDAYGVAPLTTDAQSVSYFMTDGQPTYGAESNGGPPWDQFDGDLQGNGNDVNSSPDNGIQAEEEAEWKTFLEDNDIKSYALGMGTGSVQAQLEPIAYDGASASEQPAIVVTDFADLEQTLIGTVEIPPLSGDLLNDGTPPTAGADDGWVFAVTVDGVSYQYDLDSDTASVTGGASNGVFDAADNKWTITTAAGGTLTVDMDDGDYEYLGPDMAVTEVFGYTIVDNDGDMAANTLTVTIDPADGPMVVRDDFVLTNQDPVDIPDWALLANDTGPDSDSQVISAVSNANDGSVSDNPDSVAFDDNDNDGGSFDYTNTAGSRSDDANVSVERQSGDTIQGDYLDEILIGGDDAETLNGGAGDDILIGGDGTTGTNPVARQVNLDVRSGSTFGNSNQFGFAFASGAGLYITEIRIDISSEGIL